MPHLVQIARGQNEAPEPVPQILEEPDVLSCSTSGDLDIAGDAEQLLARVARTRGIGPPKRSPARLIRTYTEIVHGLAKLFCRNC